MIQFRLERYEEKSQSAQWVKEAFGYVLDPEDWVFIAEESKRIIGTCVFAYQTGAAEAALVKSIYILPEERGQNFGDGLLRSTLHYLELQGVKNVKLLSNIGVYEFYLSEGLENVKENEFVTKLPDFFLKPCKGSGKR